MKWSNKLLILAVLGGLGGCQGDDGDDDSSVALSPSPSVSPYSTPAPSPTPIPDPRDVLECEVAVVGGGAGGLHTAFRLGTTAGDSVCLFEKGEELGGRIHDVALDEGNPDSPRFGTGARRIMEGQTVLLDLAEELGLELETPPLEADLISARGEFSFAKEDFVSLYSGLEPAESGDTETALYDLLRFSDKRANASDYADFRSYIRDVVGDEEYWFLHDMSRFRADFEYALDARGYLDYLDEEWDVCCTPSYPVGGMSSFIRGMEDEATAAGVRIFKGEAVNEIATADSGYFIGTDLHRVNAAKVVIAIPPDAMKWMEGDIAEQIKLQPEFQDIIGVKVATITQWWPNAWWQDVANPNLETNNHVWRAWTTEQCLNFIEIPLEPYGKDQMVTRTVYDDDLNCVEFWEDLAKEGTPAVEAEIKLELEYLFSNNGVTSPDTVTIPNPVKTHVQIWPNAWHWLSAGSSFTNADIFDWAIEPLSGENVALVGEAYNPQRSGWSDGAYKSSINLLNSRYGMSLPGLEATKGAKRNTKGQGGH